MTVTSGRSDAMASMQPRGHRALTDVEFDARRRRNSPPRPLISHTPSVRIVHGDAETPQAVLHAPEIVGLTGIADGAGAIGERRDGAVTQGQRLAARQWGFEMERTRRPGLEIEQEGVPGMCRN